MTHEQIVREIYKECAYLKVHRDMSVFEHAKRLHCLLKIFLENRLQSDGTGGKLNTDRKGWNTTKGKHFLVGENGTIQAGFGGKFNGKKPGAAFKKKPAVTVKPNPPVQSESIKSKTPATNATSTPGANQAKSRLQPATTVEQASEQVKQLGVNADYSNFDVETSSAMNQALDETNQLMPEIRIAAVGSFQDIEKLSIEPMLKKLEDDMIV
jgi:hypothetical protein